MQEPELPTDVTDSPVFDPPEGWTNYGDANPREHGGLWLLWQPERRSWDVVRTTPAADVHAGIDDVDAYHQYVVCGEIDVSQIYQDSRPRQGWTDTGERVANSLHIRGPGAALERLTWFAGACADTLLPRLRAGDYDDVREYDDGYRGLIESYGVDAPGDL